MFNSRYTGYANVALKDQCTPDGVDLVAPLPKRNFKLVQSPRLAYPSYSPIITLGRLEQ